MTVEFFIGRELPAKGLWPEASTGTPIDLSVGYTMPSTVVLRQSGVDVSVTATVTANAAPTTDRNLDADVPPLTVAPALNSLDTGLVTGPATLIVVVVHTATGLDREWQFPVIVKT